MSKERSGLFRSWFRPAFLRSALQSLPRSASRLGAFALVGMLVFTAVIHEAEARRMGSSRSMGRQSNMVSQQAAPARAPQQPAYTAPPAARPGMATPPARNRWLGPIAGLAAGLGIAALLSHFGLGGAFAGAMANMLVIAAIAFIAIWLIRKFTRRRDADTPAYAAAGANRSAPGFAETRYDAPPAGGYPGQQPMSTPMYDTGYAGAAGAGAAAGAGTAAPWGVPDNFDRESFLHNAKVYFIRMQAAWDAADLDDIREFTTPEMFAEVRLDLNARGQTENRTDVVRVDAELLGIEEKDSEYLASVRFSGLIREDKGAPAQEFAEVWNLAKRKQGTEGWLLAGIQQLN
ncbi:Tim44 domain-containing protein [Robbsia betulipollinis]